MQPIPDDILKQFNAVLERKVVRWEVEKVEEAERVDYCHPRMILSGIWFPTQYKPDSRSGSLRE
jgi:hypothetical protein